MYLLCLQQTGDGEIQQAGGIKPEKLYSPIFFAMQESRDSASWWD